MNFLHLTLGLALLLPGINANSHDNYDYQTNTLNMPSVAVGDYTFTNVSLKLKGFDVLAVDPNPQTNTPVNLKKIPIGDGHLTTGPTVGSVWPCQTSQGGGGAFASGAWINGDGTYDITAKPKVDGTVTWPSDFSVQLKGGARIFSGNRLPSDPTGVYPVASTDDAYAYDRNPNKISASTVQITLPQLPQMATTSSCVPFGAIGVLVNGGNLFNALDALNRDAGAHEVQDSCDGHPEVSGAYHYHTLSSCLEKQSPRSSHSALMGYAFDGFGIFGHYGENGKELSNADLDECHGHTHEIDWDGKRVNLYHYHATWEYPYTVGCFRGTPIKFTNK